VVGFLNKLVPWRLQRFQLVRRAWNCHVGIKVDGVRTLVIPNAVRRVTDSIISILGGHRDKSTMLPTVTARKTPWIGLWGLLLRWRADLDMKEITFGFQCYETKLHDG
jgi:hypothetical protein